MGPTPAPPWPLPWQATAFGAFYDVALDIATRALLWTWGATGPLAVAPVLLECLTFACTHKVRCLASTLHALPG